MDNVEGLQTRIPDNSIDLTVTSPPYDDLRDYKEYEWDFKALAQELYRVTKEGGVVVWVVGDKTFKGSETLSSFQQALYFKDIGFNVHDTMIFKKHNFSNPSNNRYHQIFEYMFVLSKGRLKTFNPIKDRKNIYAGETCWGRNSTRNRDGSFSVGDKKVYSEYGMRYNIWEYQTGKEGDFVHKNHPAPFPEKLAKDHIKSWSDEGDIVLDPFMGSGTTAKMAEMLDRKWIGFEVSEEYVDIAYKRLGKIDKEYHEELPEEEKPKQMQMF